MESSFVFIGNSDACIPLAQHLIDAGCPNASSLEEADIVFTFCTNLELLEDIYFDAHGIIATARPDTLVVDLSPASHVLARSISEMAAVSALRFVSAPVVVRDYMHPQAFSDRSNLLSFAGASRECDLDDAIGFLETMIDEVEYCKDVETAQISKHAITLQVGAQIAGLMEAEALSLAVNVNHSVGTVFDAIDLQSDAVSENLASFARALTMKNFNGGDGLTVEMLLADVNAVLQSAEDANLVIPHAESLQYLIELLVHVGGATLSPSALMLVYCDEQAGKAYGIDWSRVQGDKSHECGCDHEHTDSHISDYDDDPFGYGDPFAEFDLSDSLADEFDDFSSR